MARRPPPPSRQDDAADDDLDRDIYGAVEHCACAGCELIRSRWWQGRSRRAASRPEAKGRILGIGWRGGR